MTFRGIEDSEELGSPFELYLFEYSDSPDNEVTVTYGERSAIAGAPFGPVVDAAYNPQGTVLAVLSNLPGEAGNPPQFTFRLFRRSADGVWNLWSAGLPQPTMNTRTLAWSHDGIHLTIGSDNVAGEDNIAVYRFGYGSSDNATTVSKITLPLNTPVNRPVSGGGVNKVAYSPDGLHLVIAHDGSPYVSVYRRSADSYVHEAFSLDQNPPGVSTDLAFVDANTLLISSVTGAPLVYRRSGNNYARHAVIPMDLTGGLTSTKIGVSRSQRTIVATKSGPPYVEVFKINGDGDPTRSHDLLGRGASSPVLDFAFNEVGNRMVLCQASNPTLLSYAVDDGVVFHKDGLVRNESSARVVEFRPGDDELFLGKETLQPLLSTIPITVEFSSLKGYFAYTNFERDVTRTVPLHGEIVFKAVPITRQAYSSNGKSEPTNMTLRMPRDQEMAKIMIPYPTPRPVAITIFATHTDDPDAQTLAIWSGRLLSLSRDGDEAVMNCDSSIVSLKRLGLRRNYQFGCPYVLYGRLCKADKDAATIETVVVDVVNGKPILAGGWFADKNPEHFAGGMISWTSSVGREVRTIRRSDASGNIDFMGLSRGMRIGTKVTLSLGCNHRREHCKDIHNNIQNFGGQPWIPLENPVKYHPFW